MIRQRPFDVQDAVVGVREPFAMATPDYLEQVIVSGRNRPLAGEAHLPRVGLFHRPSVTSLIWATLDLLTVAVATAIAMRFRIGAPSNLHPAALHHYLHAQRIMFIYVAWFGLLSSWPGPTAYTGPSSAATVSMSSA